MKATDPFFQQSPFEPNQHLSILSPSPRPHLSSSLPSTSFLPFSISFHPSSFLLFPLHPNY